MDGTGLMRVKVWEMVIARTLEEEQGPTLPVLDTAQHLVTPVKGETKPYQGLGNLFASLSSRGQRNLLGQTRVDDR